MASPFPGVDPYIEAQGLWEGFHAGFVTYCRDTLNEVLPEHYVAELGERLRLIDVGEAQGKSVVPDVHVARERRGRVSPSRPARGRGGTITLEPVRISLPTTRTEIREVWIEIRRVPGRIPVAVIEVLSPTNKTGEGFYEYNQKRRKLIEQNLHLVEIDLLLRGERLPMDDPLPKADYYALISRAEERPQCSVYSWTMRDPLPSIPVPLIASDPAVALDLAAVFATEYDRGRYARRIDYSAPPTSIKNPSDRAWAQRTARARRR